MKKNHIIVTIVTSDPYHVQRNNLGTYIFALLLSFIITSKVFFQKEDWIYFLLKELNDKFSPLKLDKLLIKLYEFSIKSNFFDIFESDDRSDRKIRIEKVD